MKDEPANTVAMNDSTESRLLATAGRLLLEYNDSTREIEETLAATAAAISPAKFATSISYSGIVIWLGDNPPLLIRVCQLHHNASLQAHVHSILAKVKRGKLDCTEAIHELKLAEAKHPLHPRWMSIAATGVAAAALATLLGADVAAVAIAGVASALGLLARQVLAKRNASLLTLPLTAAFIGAAFGAMALRFGWTQTPGLAVIVPSLMIIPGPHLINGLIDLIDNNVPMGFSRLGLAGAILLASAIGVVAGMELFEGNSAAASSNPQLDHLNVLWDMVLAGAVTCGFAVFYNVGMSDIRLAIIGGALGHGFRYVGLGLDWSLATATLLGAFVTGSVSAWISRTYKLPFAGIAFAGAVTMMPGIQMYRAIRGFLQLTREPSEFQIAADALGDLSQAVLVVCALSLGLVVAKRTVDWVGDLAIS